MKLHEDIENFKSAIVDINLKTGILESFIEKDYWIFSTLKYLRNGRYGNDIVFKGGTSLSKGHKIVQRFSEDIDLTLDSASLRSETGTFTKDLVKRCNSKIKNDLIANFLPINKKEFFREKGELKTIPLDYSPIFPSEVIKQDLTVELTAIDFDTPNRMLPISSFITDYLVQNNRNDLIELYNLQPFEIKVVDVEKTLCEKIFRLNKRGETEGIIGIGLKLRDVYDISIIISHPQYQQYIQSDHFCKDLFEVEQTEIKKIEDWTKSLNERGDNERAQKLLEKNRWLHQSVSNSYIFSNPEALLNVNPKYKIDLDMFVYGEPVNLQQMVKSIHELSEQLKRYDKWKLSHYETQS